MNRGSFLGQFLDSLLHFPFTACQRHALVLTCLLTAFLSAGCRRSLAVLTISATSDTVKIGTPISVESNLKNVTNKDISELLTVELRSGTAFECAVAMRDEAGTLLPETPLGSKTNGHTDLTGGVVRVSLRIQPGSAIVGPVKVSELFDVQKPGKYTVQVHCPVFRGTEDPQAKSVEVTTVTSNIIPITVLK